MFDRGRRAQVETGVAVASVCLALTQTLLMVIGVLRFRSPLPHWDMWLDSGTLAFWLGLGQGDQSVWWQFHNEHRIVLARVAFWLDFTLVHGRGWLLLLSNVCCALATGVLLVWTLRQRLLQARASLDPRTGFLVLASTLIALAVSWLQNENLLRGFQVTFFLGTLVPLLALVLLSWSGDPEAHSSRGRAVIAIFTWITTFACVATLAIGVMIPWLATLWLILLRRPLRLVLAYAVPAPVVTAVYFIGYQTPSNSSPPMQTLLEHPLAVAQFFLAYLGAPWSTLTGVADIGIACGAFFACATTAYTVRQLRARNRSGYGLALTMYLLLVLAWAAVTAMSRLRFGLDYASISRYETPVLVGWAVLLIIAAPRFQRRIGLMHRGYSLLLVLPAALISLLLTFQLHVFDDNRKLRFANDVATMALALGIPDYATTYTVVWDPRSAVARAAQARAAGVTVFADAPWKELGARIGTPAPPTGEVPCTGWISQVAGVHATDARRIEGHVLTSVALGDANGVVTLENSRGRIVGFGVISSTPITHASPQRHDAASRAPNSPAYPFVGYLAAGEPADDLTVADGRFRCLAPLQTLAALTARVSP